ncbi:MAG: A/G-specific adenine glycosylase, partial [Alphaproteobacteria bacterium]
AWYDRNRRRLPWRAEPGQTPDPYRVWLSEIMLQQTTVAAVAPYFQRFTRRWPDVAALARASLDDVLAEWQGLGYYARARNLHRAAKLVEHERGGRFPDDEEGLARLPGVGRYTAAAIAAIAFGRRAAAMDANAERVVARLFAVEAPVAAAKRALAAHALSLVPTTRCGDFAQAVMDLGATVCTPRAPKCDACPLEACCVARARGWEDRIPVRKPKAARPTRRGVAYWLERGDGAVWLRRRPEAGLLGGMVEVPSSDWRLDSLTPKAARAAAPVKARWRALPGVVRHSFTHFHLELVVLAARMDADAEGRGADGRGARAGGAFPGSRRGFWAGPADMARLALPTVMKKVIHHARSAGTGRGRAKDRPGSKGSAAQATSRPRR